MYYPCSENKGADQLRSYCEADLRLCFRIGENPVFSRRGSLYYYDLSVCIITVLLQGLNTLKYCMDADDDVFDVNNDMEAPILSLVGDACSYRGKSRD